MDTAGSDNTEVDIKAVSKEIAEDLKVISAKIKKFNLIGIPYQIIIGNKSEGSLLEFKEVDGETQKLTIDEITSKISKAKAN